MTNETTQQRLTRLRIQSFSSLPMWPAGVVAFDQIATPEQIRWKDWLEGRIRKAYPNQKETPRILVLRADPQWRDDMRLVAADRTVLQGPHDRLRMGGWLMLNTNIIVTPADHTIYISEAALKTLNGPEMAAVLGHEIGHLAMNNHESVARRIYGNSLLKEEFYQNVYRIRECQADRFTPIELRLALVSALRKVTNELEPEMYSLFKQLRAEAGIPPRHPDTELRIKGLMEDISKTDLAATEGLLIDAECRIVTAPLPTPRATNDTPLVRN